MIRRLILTELTLNLRDWATIAFGLVVPVVLMIVLGSLPESTSPTRPSAGGVA